MPSAPRTVLRSLLTLLVCAPLTITGPAAGAVLDSGTEEFSFSETIRNFCGVSGLRVRLDATVVIDFRLVQHGSDELPYYTEHVAFSGVYTNLRTGQFVTAVETTLGKDLSVTDNGDGTFTIVAFGTGNATIYDSTGTAIGRNPGQLRFEITVDNGGTPSDPSDDEFVSFDGILLGSTGRSDDFCEVTVPALT